MIKTLEPSKTSVSSVSEAYSVLTIKCYCHLFHENSGKSFCGVPRPEQDKHRGWSENIGLESCPRCGLETCEKCQIIVRLAQIN